MQEAIDAWFTAEGVIISRFTGVPENEVDSPHQYDRAGDQNTRPEHDAEQAFDRFVRYLMVAAHR
jgi:hypothetical protein